MSDGDIMREGWTEYIRDIYRGNITYQTEQELVSKYVPDSVRDRLDILIREHYQDKPSQWLDYTVGLASAFVAITISLGLFNEQKFNYDWYVRNFEQLVAQIVHDVNTELGTVE
jgi:hypothetical protein